MEAQKSITMENIGRNCLDFIPIHSVVSLNGLKVPHGLICSFYKIYYQSAYSLKS